MSIGRRRARHVLGWGLATGLLVTVIPIVPQAARAAGSITPSRDANAVTSALTMTTGVVTSAAFDAIPPSGNPAAVSTQPLTAFPSDSTSYAILSTGDATQAGVNDQSQFTSVSDGGGNLRGNTDYDATVLKIGLNVPDTGNPATANNCLQFDFQFLSEEFPEFKGSAYNDAFIAELDSSNWTTSGSNISAPNNFALDDSNPPSEVSVNSLGDTRVTQGQATNTIYDGATFPLVASKSITPGVHNLYLSLFDQGDSIYDSAVFVDGLRVGHAGPGGCGSGARREISNLAMTATPSTPTGIVTSNLADVPMTGVAQHSSTAT
ncbi:MAG TPA: choice-of-anchor L domain-containing protein, partial [Actinomycetota bacterium]|nr:choice-of-anchor L domain-containing protein [Actinomycetota bacterium]